ncbi:enoyl-CoA hydratase/isomerase family protein [Amycolatopsis methanolica]|nr:enoyl-CoA hydratase/isomerase family protein [Amycolatopsis methanolica]
MLKDEGSMTGHPYQTILLERTDTGVAVVTLNRPEVLNAFNEAMRADFARLWTEVREDPGIRAVVLRAAGDRAFSTGLDVTERTGSSDSPWLDTAEPWAETEDPGHQLSPKRNGLWKPVVAAVHGMCAGGAFYWITECDIVICSPEATFFDPHVTYGMVAALEPIALSYRMHFSETLRMALLGLYERMTAETARSAGLVTEIVDRDELHARALQLAEAIAAQPPAAVQGTVKAMWQSLDRTRVQALDTALMYTQIGNPIGADGLDRTAAKPAKWWTR